MALHRLLPLLLLCLVAAPVATGVPIADFSANVTNGTAPLAVQFTDHSTLKNLLPLNMADGGEDGTITGQIVYDGAVGTSDTAEHWQGARSIKIVQSADENSGSMTDYITNLTPSTHYTFSYYTKGTDGTGLAIVTGFDGDGTPISAVNWTEDYEINGTWTRHDIILHLWSGMEQIVVEFRTRNNPGPVFWLDGLQLELGDGATAWDAPKNISGWAWDMDGDLSADSADQNPVFEYTNPGTYNVTLEATNADGTGSETKTDYITVTGGSAGGTPANIGLTSSFGSTWIQWAWTLSSLDAGQIFVARYDGAEVINHSAASGIPLVQVYAKTGIGPNEPHVFEAILLDAGSTVNATETSTVTTAQSEGYAQMFLLLAVGLPIVALFLGRTNRIMAIILFLVAFIMAGYVGVSTVGTNTILSLFGILLAVVCLLGLGFSFIEKVREDTGWGT